MNEQVTE